MTKKTIYQFQLNRVSVSIVKTELTKNTLKLSFDLFFELIVISVGLKNKGLEYQTELDTMDVGRYQEFMVKI